MIHCFSLGSKETNQRANYIDIGSTSQNLAKLPNIRVYLVIHLGRPIIFRSFSLEHTLDIKVDTEINTEQ